MASPNFKFDLKQRVVVPAADGAQGVVVARLDSVDGAPIYRVRLDSEKGPPREAMYVEHDLVVAQGGDRAVKARDKHFAEVQDAWDQWNKPARAAKHT
jgi:hypothetical protein